MELYYDLHIHSCLSPCGDNLMTPANICGMAFVKGLELIALTDHNTCRNCAPFLECAAAYGLLALPGMELETSEEIHVVCLFSNLDDALAWDSFVYEHLMKIPNRPEIFGEQIICDVNDVPCGNIEPLLLAPTDISFDEVYPLVHRYNGIMIPAHIDRPANSLLETLGGVPPESLFTCFEIKDVKNLHRARQENPYLDNCRVIIDSDAHYLENIHEPVYKLAVEEKTPECILRTLEEAPKIPVQADL